MPVCAYTREAMAFILKNLISPLVRKSQLELTRKRGGMTLVINVWDGFMKGGGRYTSCVPWEEKS